MITVKADCRVCKNDYLLEVEQHDLEKWKNRLAPIQDCMPYLSAENRELLISKTCGKCWKEMFGDDE